MDKEKLRNSVKSVLKSDFIQELFFSSIGCLFFIGLYKFFPKQYWNAIYRTTFLLILTLSFFLIFLVLNQVNSKNNFYSVNYKRTIILFSIFNFAAYLFLFYNTHWGYNALKGDNFYRTAYITKMYYSGIPQDFAYKGLSAYYAPFYWYCLALIAIIFHIAPYKMVRIGMLITVYILPIILFEFWKKIYDQKLALIITIISSSFLVNIYDPDHMIGGFLILPYFMYYYENIKEIKYDKSDYFIAGIIGSIIFCTYFLYFLLIPIYYLISLIQNPREFKNNLKRILIITCLLILFSCWFWIPILRDILFIGFESHQNRFIWSTMFTYPLLNIIMVSPWIIGLVYIIHKYNLSREMKILGNFLLSVHILFLIGFIGLMINFPIMHIRIISISGYILVISTCIAYVRFFYYLAENNILKSNKIKINLYQFEIFFVISIMTVQCYSHWHFISVTPSYQLALKRQSMREIRDIFEELDYEDKVFLTSEWRIAAFLPIYLFLLPNPYFAHPSALHNERVKFLIKLSECNSSKEVYKKIVNNKFDRIDYIFLTLKENSTKLVFAFEIDNYPEGRDFHDIEFKIELFEDEKYFERIEINDALIFRTKY